MFRPIRSLRLRKFLTRILQRSSPGLHTLRLYQGGRMETRSFQTSDELWEALRTVGLSDIKVKVS